jgi:hypothetical protein
VAGHALPETLNGFENEAIQGQDREAECLLLVGFIDIDQGLRWRYKAPLYSIPQDIDRLQPVILFRIFWIQFKICPKSGRKPFICRIDCILSTVADGRDERFACQLL